MRGESSLTFLRTNNGNDSLKELRIGQPRSHTCGGILLSHRGLSRKYAMCGKDMRCRVIRTGDVRRFLDVDYRHCGRCRMRVRSTRLTLSRKLDLSSLSALRG